MWGTKGLVSGVQIHVSIRRRFSAEAEFSVTSGSGRQEVPLDSGKVVPLTPCELPQPKVSFKTTSGLRNGRLRAWAQASRGFRGLGVQDLDLGVSKV